MTQVNYFMLHRLFCDVGAVSDSIRKKVFILLTLLTLSGGSTWAQTTWDFLDTATWGAEGVTLNGGAQLNTNGEAVSEGGVTFTGTSGFVSTALGIGFYSVGSVDDEHISLVVPAGYKASVTVYTSSNRTVVAHFGDADDVTFNAAWSSSTKEFDNAEGSAATTLILYCNQNAGGSNQKQAPFLQKIVLTDMSTVKSYPWTATAVATIDGAKTTLKTYRSQTDVVEGSAYTVVVDKAIEYDGSFYVLNDYAFVSDVYGVTYTMGDAAATYEYNYEKAGNVVFYGEAENIFKEGKLANKAEDIAVLSNGGGYSAMGTEGHVTFTFSVPEDYTYTLALGMNNTNSRERGFNYSIDGADVSETITVPANTPYVQEITDLTLTAGEHTITLNITYSLTPVFDYILVSKQIKRWDFTAWSTATVDNLKAEAALGASAGAWSDMEKADGSAVTNDIAKDNCFWQVTAGSDSLKANGSAIAETAGLTFTNLQDRALAIAVNYGDCSSVNGTDFGPYHGPSYLWLGSKNINYFVIRHVIPGTTIKMGVEPHQLNTERGVALIVGTNEAGTQLTDASGNAVAYPTTYTEQEWLLPATGITEAANDDGTYDIMVRNNNGCHIYFIEATCKNFTGKLGPLFFKENTIEGVSMQFRVVSEEDKTCEVYATPYESGVTFVPAVSKSTEGVVTVPAEAYGYKVIGLSSWCFYSCSSISEIVLPETITYIGESAFRMAKGLQNINVPEGITEIGERTFSGCTTLRSIKLPEGLTTLGKSAFANNYLLETIILPSTLTSIATSTFQHPRLLQSVTVKMETPIELGTENFNSSKTPVLYVPMTCKAAYEASEPWASLFTGGIIGYYRTGDIFTAPTAQGIEMQFRVLDEDEKTCEVYTTPYEDGVQFVPAIDENFEGELIIPDSIEGFRVTAIGSWSFRNCQGITSVTLPATITRIETSAFRTCYNLVSVNIPEGVTFIGEQAFFDCPINVITLPSTLKEMEKWAFRNKNEESTTSYVTANMPEPCTARPLSLGGNIKTSTLYVPVGTKEAYAAAEGFNYFKKILEIGETDEETATTDAVYASAFDITASEQAKLIVRLNTSTANYTKYQMHLVLPEGLSIATDDQGVCLLETAVENANLTLQAASQGDGSYQIEASSKDGTAVATAGNADLLSITVIANGAMTAGEYTARIESILLATESGAATPADTTFAIKVETAAAEPEQGIVSMEDVETEAAMEISLPIILNNTTDITAFYFDLTLPKGITVAEQEDGQLKAELVDDYTDGTMILMSSPIGANKYRFIATLLTDDGKIKANAGHIMNINIKIGDLMTSGVFTAKLQIVKLVETEVSSENTNRAAASTGNDTSFGTITVKGSTSAVTLGDVNQDGNIDGADVASLIAHILKNTPSDFCAEAADMNSDGEIDGADVATLIDIILKK